MESAAITLSKCDKNCDKKSPVSANPTFIDSSAEKGICKLPAFNIVWGKSGLQAHPPLFNDLPNSHHARPVHVSPMRLTSMTRVRCVED